jgi:hypothetical protein
VTGNAQNGRRGGRPAAHGGSKAVFRVGRRVRGADLQIRTPMVALGDAGVRMIDSHHWQDYNASETPRERLRMLCEGNHGESLRGIWRKDRCGRKMVGCLSGLL